MAEISLVAYDGGDDVNDSADEVRRDDEGGVDKRV